VIRVTGLGAICSVGHNHHDVFHQLKERRGQRDSAFRTSSHLLRQGSQGDLPQVAEVSLTDQELATALGLSPKLRRRTSRAALLALHAIDEAVKDAKLQASDYAPTRIGIYGASSLAGTTDLEILFREYTTQGKCRRPRLVLSGSYSALNDLLAQYYGWQGTRVLISTACSSSTVALQLAKADFDSDKIDVAVVYGVDPIGELSVAGFRALGGLSKTLTSPFSVGDFGLSLGEGAAALVLETKSRDNRTYAYLGGVGITSEAYHPTAPEPSGRGARGAISRALKTAGVQSDFIEGAYAHGTGTELNDVAETKAIALSLGPSSSQIALVSTKGATGHTLGAAGAINAVLACLSLHHGEIPPSPGFVSARKGCTLPVVRDEVHRREYRGILANSFGFGGSNASAVFLKQASGKNAQAVQKSEIWITGVGGLTPFGPEACRLEAAILAGTSAIRKGEVNPSFSGRCQTAYRAVVDLNDSETQTWLRKSRNHRKLDRLSSLASVATATAMRSAGLKLGIGNRDRVGIYFGTDTGPIEVIHQFFRNVVSGGIGAGNPSLFPNTVLNACLGYISIDQMIQGPAAMISQGEVSSGVAIGVALTALQTDAELDAVICGGVDEHSLILEKAYLDLGHIPSDLCSEKKSEGYWLGEGSIALVLEKKSFASARGIKPLAKLVGSLSSGHSIPGAHYYAQEASAITQLLDQATRDFGMPDLVVLNTTGLAKIDSLLVKGKATSQVNSTPSYSAMALFGNPRGSSTALGVFAAITAIKNQILPPSPGVVPGVPTSTAIQRVFVLTASCGGYSTLQIVEKGDTQ